MQFILQELPNRFRRWVGQGRLKNARVRRVIWGALFFALLTFILSVHISPQRLDLKVGGLAPIKLKAPRDLENRVATERKRLNAANAIPTLTKTDEDVLRQTEEFINATFSDIRTVRGLPNQDEKTKLEDLSSRVSLGSPLQPAVFNTLLRVDASSLETARQDSLRMVRAILSAQVLKGDVADLRAKVDADALPDFTMKSQEPNLKVFVRELVKSRIRSNQVEDEEATRRLKEQAIREQLPVMMSKGECCVIEEGKTVTQEQYAMLEDLGLIGSRADYRSFSGTALMSAVLVGLIAFYLVRYRPDILEKDSQLLLVGIIGILTLLLSLIMRSFSDSLGTGVAYLMPVAFNAMLLTILLDPKLALLQSVVLALITGMITQVDQLNHVLVGIVGSVVGIYMVTRVESRTDIYRAGLFVALGNVVTIIAIYLMQAVSILDLQIWKDAGLGALNGLIVAVLVTGALPFFENLFGVVTPLKLIELSNPNHPLLKKLLVEAPGSYHHTILVANLCEAAAEAIGADQVLARVGAYYHDIGKAKRPYFFVENQFGGENPHDKLPPSLSALIITSHVKDGYEMAKEARLPKEIIDFIPEHHGTTLVSYFYHLASKNGQSEFVLEEDFRYDGPKPRTKETAICMLADGCEASVRAMRQKGSLAVDQIETQVKRIIEDRLHQGQLDNCDLTLRELDTITRTFVKVLTGVHHARIEYPPEVGKLPAPSPPVAKEAQEALGNGDMDQQRPGEDGPDGSPGGDGAPGGGDGPASDRGGPRE